MAQSNEQGGDTPQICDCIYGDGACEEHEDKEQGGDELEAIKNELALKLDGYASADPKQFNNRTNAGFKMEAEYFIVRMRAFHHKQERAYRKQHELEARLDEAERFLHYDLFGTLQRIERTNDAVNRRIAELKAERDVL